MSTPLQDDEETFTTALMDMAAQILAPLASMVIGHRRSLIEGGISEEAADEMASDAHHFCTTLILSRFDEDEPEDPA